MIEEELSVPEKLYLLRRRTKATKEAMAKLFGLRLADYRRLERGEGAAPTIKLNGIDQHERCVVLRLRAGLTVNQVAERMGIAPYWVRRMETGTARIDRLVEFWNSC